MSREKFLTQRLAERSEELGRLREALEQISRKRKLDACAAASMQAIARGALSPSPAHRGTGA